MKETYIVIENDKVVNLIIIAETQINEIKKSTQEIIKNEKLAIGDYRENGKWYRDIEVLNANGEIEKVKQEIK